MKEEDAKKMICPQLLAASISKGILPSNIDEEKRLIAICSCKGSGCAMWQSTTAYAYNEKLEVEPITEEKGDCGLKHKTYSRVGDIEVSE